MFKDYHIIFVPKDKNRTKTFKISGFTLKVLLFTFIISIPLIFVAVLSTIHYQNKLITLKKTNYENQKLVENRQTLINRLAKLEKKLLTLDDSIGHLGEIMDIDPQTLRFGTGPIGDLDFSLPDDFDDDVGAVATQDLIDTWVADNGALTINKFDRKLSRFHDEVQSINKKLEEIYSLNRDKINYVNATPNTLPTVGWITSGFGIRKHPIAKQYKMHNGIDIASPNGTPIKAPANGKIVFAGRSAGYGKTLVVQHGYGISTMYAHLNKIHVTKGTIIKKNELIAEVGNTGYTTGSHLHYEVHVDGIPIDPLAMVVQ
jgi:murein DD-endopeptidase MepM/ murein hydrolase activator NlpD